MPGLIEDTTGLYYGRGLSFEPSLGGAGLTNTPTIDTSLFIGVGSLSASTHALLAIKMAYSGTGGLSAATFVKGAQLDQANFAGAGGLVAVTKLVVVARATFGGNGSLSVLTS